MEQMRRISEVVRLLVADQYPWQMGEVLAGLEREGMVYRRGSELTQTDRQHLREVFDHEILPVLTPLAIDSYHPFPHLRNRALTLAVLLRRPHHGKKLFALVQVPARLPRFVPLAAEKGLAFTTLETVLRYNLPVLFPGMTICSATAFRLIREDESDDLSTVRMEIEGEALPEVERFLATAIGLGPAEVFRIPGILELTGFFAERRGIQRLTRNGRA